MPSCILTRVPHEKVCAGARVSKKRVIHVKLKSWLKPLGPRVPYLEINLIPCFLRYSWLARLASNTTTFVPSSVWLVWLKWAGTRRSFLPLMASHGALQSGPPTCVPSPQCPLLMDILSLHCYPSWHDGWHLRINDTLLSLGTTCPFQTDSSSLNISCVNWYLTASLKIWTKKYIVQQVNYSNPECMGV